MLIAIIYYSVCISILKKQKELIKDYEQLLILKDWYEKIPEEQIDHIF